MEAAGATTSARLARSASLSAPLPHRSHRTTRFPPSPQRTLLSAAALPLRRTRFDAELACVARSAALLHHAPIPTILEANEEEASLDGSGRNNGSGGGRRGGGSQGSGCDMGEYYRCVLRVDPRNPLLLSNYGKYLHEGKPERVVEPVAAGDAVPMMRSTASLCVVLYPQPHAPPSFPRSRADRFLVLSSLSTARLDGPYLLHLAADDGDAAAVRLIMRRQPHLLPFLERCQQAAAVPDAEPYWQAPPLPLHAAEVRRLGPDALAARDRDGRTVLHAAAAAGEAEAVAVLVDMGGGRGGAGVAAAGGY